MLSDKKKRSMLLPVRSDGFSLIEIAIVLVVVGLLLTTGMALWRTTMKTSKWSSAKSDLKTINESLKAFALTRGRLPCPDVTVPPDGVEDCPSTNCGTPPCGLPYVTIAVDGVDNWRGNYSYDVIDALTTTNQNTFCTTLFAIINTTGTGGATIQPCVTDYQGDTSDDGQIDASGRGYTVAAVTISGGDVPGRSRKNSNSDGEYEMASNPYEDNIYNDLVGELTLNALYGEACDTDNTTTTITLQGFEDTTGPGEGGGGVQVAAQYRIDSPTALCQDLVENNSIDISSGQTIFLYPDSPGNCNGPELEVPFFDGTEDPHPSCPSCENTPPGPPFDLYDCDACSGGPKNETVEVDGNTNNTVVELNNI